MPDDDAESRPGQEPDAPADGAPGADEDHALKRLLQETMGRPETRSVDVLQMVQQRLFEKSGGKFYGDGWSTSHDPPVATFLVTTLIMLAVAIAIYVLLGTTCSVGAG